MKLLFLLLLSVSVFASNCSQFFYQNFVPVVHNSDTRYEICNDEYVTVYDANLKAPLFSANVLRGTKHLPRVNAFHEEQSIPVAVRDTLEDYDHSGYDRGHLVPSGDATTKQSQFQTFTLANMIPQVGVCNRGPWKHLEEMVRQIAQTQVVYVISGPIYINKSTFIGNHVLVPDAMYKLIIVPQRKAITAIVMKNEKSCDYRVVSLSEVEQLTNITFTDDNIDKSIIDDFLKLNN